MNILELPKILARRFSIAGLDAVVFATIFLPFGGALPLVAAELIRIAPGRNAVTATAVSADGSTVVGYATSIDGVVPFRWTNTEGLIELPILPGRPDTRALGVSEDGTVVVGYGSGFGIESLQREAFYWTAAEGIVGIGDIPGGQDFSEAQGVSKDGSVIVGYGTGTGGREAFRWRRGVGIQGLGSLYTYPPNVSGLTLDSEAVAVSSSGFRVAGNFKFGFPSSDPNGFLWQEATGMIPLAGEVPDPVPFAGNEVHSMSPGGFWTTGIRGFEVVRWNEVTGFESILGMDQNNSSAGISDDGNVIVGNTTLIDNEEVFVWQNNHGVIGLRGMLSAAGVDMSQWEFLQVTGLSGDGYTLCGNGVYSGVSEAFIVKIDRLSPPLVVPFGLKDTSTPVAISFVGQAGVIHQLQISTDLGYWSNHGSPVVGNGSTQSVVLPVGFPRLFGKIVTIQPVAIP